MLATVTTLCLLTLGCQSADPPTWLREVVNQAESLYPDGARATSRALILDVASVRRALAGVNAEPVTDAEVVKVLGRPFKALERSEAITCDMNGEGCHVLYDGLLVIVDSLSRSGDNLTVKATYISTVHRVASTATCSIPAELLLRAAANVWTLVSARGLRRC